MTAPLDEKGRCATEGCERRATRDLQYKGVGSRYCDECAVKIIKDAADNGKYLSAVALPDELEVVAWRVTDATGNCWLSWERPKGGLPADWKAEPLITLSQAHSTIAALRAERDAWMKAVADIASSVALSDTIKATGSIKDMIAYFAGLRARAETAEAEVKRLTEEKEALREALGNMRCPRPCNHRPDEFDAKDCVAAGECGCGAAILSGDLNAPS